MAALAKEIKLTQAGLWIDGKEFPWYITEEGARPSPVNRQAELPYVTLSIACDRIIVEDDLDKRMEARKEDRAAAELLASIRKKEATEAPEEEQAA